MSSDRPVLLAVELDGDGAHPAAWRQSGRAPADVLRPSALRAAVASAEESGFTFATFADDPVAPSSDGAGDVDGDGLDVAGRIEAGTRAAYVSTRTNRLGLAPTLHATATEPFHLATQLASLDHASRGRAAWLVGAANTAGARATIGAEPLSAAARRQEVLDVIDTARLLWDSWQDDAVIKDEATGRYLDPTRVHHINFRGASFSVKGPLITPRPPQGQVVVIAPAELDVDDRADVVLVGPTDLVSLPERTQRARTAGARLVFVDVEVVLDTERHSALERLARLDEATPWTGIGRLRHVGSASELLALVDRLAGTVDGVRFLPAVHSVDRPLISSQVVAPLAAAGRLRAPVAGASLRDSLGLPRPANRFATAGA